MGRGGSAAFSHPAESIPATPSPVLSPAGRGTGRDDRHDPAPTVDDLPDALVVFCDGEKPDWVRLLRPGFRHVFVALRDGPHWLTVDPLCQRMEVQVQPVPPDMDLAAWFRAHGMTVVPATIDRSGTAPAPVAPFTCVEAVKRVLGLRDRFVLTPWQLYRRLTRPDMR